MRIKGHALYSAIFNCIVWWFTRWNFWAFSSASLGFVVLPPLWSTFTVGKKIFLYPAMVIRQPKSTSSKLKQRLLSKPPIFVNASFLTAKNAPLRDGSCSGISLLFSWFCFCPAPLMTA